MPIAVHVVSEKDYTAWLDQAKKKFADSDAAPAVAKPDTIANPTAVAAAEAVK
jgi:heme/copper-type cytochrome/quinol oxidase subunit 2